MRTLLPLLHNDFAFTDNVFDDFFNNFAVPAKSGYTIPKVDIEDTDKAYVLTTDLPGVAKEDISVTYADDVLTLSAKHEEQNDQQDEQKHYIRKERTSQSFCRQFTVRDIRREDIQASFKDGVLTITLPKQDQQQIEQSHQITID